MFLVCRGNSRPDRYSDQHPDEHPDSDTNVYADRDTDLYDHSDFYDHANALQDAHRNPYRHPDHQNRYAEEHRHGHQDAGADGDSYHHAPDANSDPNSRPGSDQDAGNADPCSDTENPGLEYANRESDSDHHQYADKDSDNDAD